MDSNIVTIGGVTSAVIAYKGQRVCTTQQLAQFYGCADRNLTDNFQRNADRFEEGKHFIRIEGDELRTFKAHYPADSGVVAERAPHLILWTERGAARHAKMLTTAEAWEVFEQMEDVYFHVAEAGRTKAKAARVSDNYREAAAITRDSLKIYKLLGVDDGMAKVIAAKEVRAATGLDFTPLLLGVTATNDPPLTVNQLVERLGIGARSEEVNAALEHLGFQVKERWTSPRGGPRSKWVLTEAGKEHGSLVPYQAEKNEHAGFRVVWKSSVIDIVRPLVEHAVATRPQPKRSRTRIKAAGEPA